MGRLVLKKIIEEELTKYFSDFKLVYNKTPFYIFRSPKDNSGIYCLIKIQRDGNKICFEFGVSYNPFSKGMPGDIFSKSKSLYMLENNSEQEDLRYVWIDLGDTTYNARKIISSKIAHIAKIADEYFRSTRSTMGKDVIIQFLYASATNLTLTGSDWKNYQGDLKKSNYSTNKLKGRLILKLAEEIKTRFPDIYKISTSNNIDLVYKHYACQVIELSHILN